MAVEVVLALGDGLGDSADGELINLQGQKASRSGVGTRERPSPQNISAWLDYGLHSWIMQERMQEARQGGVRHRGRPAGPDCELSS